MLTEYPESYIRNMTHLHFCTPAVIHRELAASLPLHWGFPPAFWVKGEPVKEKSDLCQQSGPSTGLSNEQASAVNR